MYQNFTFSQVIESNLFKYININKNIELFNSLCELFFRLNSKTKLCNHMLVTAQNVLQSVNI